MALPTTATVPYSLGLVAETTIYQNEAEGLQNTSIMICIKLLEQL